MPLPRGTTNFSEIEQFQALVEGEYEGHVEYVRFKDGSDRNKSDQLSVCLVSDEEDTQGEKTWQNLYFTDKSMYRMAEFFGLFGIESIDWDTAISDEEPFDLLDPDLSGEPVRFAVYADGKYNGKPSFKAEVTEWLGSKAKPKAASAKAKDPEAEQEEAEEAEAKPKPKRFGAAAAKPAAAAGKRSFR